MMEGSGQTLGAHKAMNWLDAVILVVLAFFAYSEVRQGFLAGLISLMGLIISMAVPFLLYAPFGRQDLAILHCSLTRPRKHHGL